LPQERKQLRKRKCTPQSSSFFFFTVATTILIEIDEEKSEREREKSYFDVVRCEYPFSIFCGNYIIRESHSVASQYRPFPYAV
jgi:hypothetical protein